MVNRGAFIGCANYPTCQYTRPVHEQTKVEDRVLPGSECPECGHELAVKQGRYGMFIGCTNFPACHHIEHDGDDEADTSDEVDVPKLQKRSPNKEDHALWKSLLPLATLTLSVSLR